MVETSISQTISQIQIILLLNKETSLFKIEQNKLFKFLF